MKRFSLTVLALILALAVQGLAAKPASATACDDAGDCKGVTEEATPPSSSPSSTPSSATGCFIPGRTGCHMVSNSCVCDPLPSPDHCGNGILETNAGEECEPGPYDLFCTKQCKQMKKEDFIDDYGFLCITAEKCKIAVIENMGGKRTCEFKPDPVCGVPNPQPTPSSPADPTGTPSDPDQPKVPGVPSAPSSPAPSLPAPSQPAPAPAPVDNPPPCSIPVLTPPAEKSPEEGFCDALPLEDQACCEAAGGSPFAFMKQCVSDASREPSCNIVVDVAGDLGIGDRAQVNLCCNLVNNSGTIDGAVEQACENSFGPSSVGGPSKTKTPTQAGTPAKSGAAQEGNSSPKDLDSAFLKGGGEGCTLAAHAAAPGPSLSLPSLVFFASTLLLAARSRRRGKRRNEGAVR